TEDTNANVQAHPLYDAYWRSKEVDLAAIDVPAYVVASWSDQGLHTRGTIEAWRWMSSPQKWLEIHGQKKWANYYRPESRAKQAAFFDHFLKNSDSGVESWPPVSIEVCESAYVRHVRAESEWPIARTEYRALYLDAATGLMHDEPTASETEVRYDPTDESGEAVFDFRFTEDTEVTGYMKLKLWVEAED